MRNKLGENEVTIERLCLGGRGLGRLPDGKVVFVPLVLPGETVVFRPLRQTRSYIEAELVEILAASPRRVAAHCPHFGVCGGCDWQHLPYEFQLETKQGLLGDEIGRQLGLAPKLLAPAASPEAYGYRCHARLQIDGQAGFYARGSHNVVALKSCPVLNAPLTAGLERLKALNLDLASLESIELMAPGDELLVQLNQRAAAGQTAARLADRIYEELAPAGLALRRPHGDQFVKGRASISYAAGGCRVRSTFGGFIQANMAVNALLLEHVNALLAGTPELLELFSGSGNLSLPLARSCGHVTAVELNSAQVRQAKALARENAIDNLEFKTGDAAAAIAGGVEASAVLLDPPREGARQVAEQLAASTVKQIVYVSCNPATLARDLKTLTGGGFRLASLKLFDMFPQTSHIEAVAELER